jgi:AraC family ethanolamine operon transcriptional activator
MQISALPKQPICLPQSANRNGAASPQLPKGVARPFAFTTIDGCHPTEFDRGITGWQNCFEQVERGPFRGRLSELWLWPIQLVHERLDQSCAYQGRAWENCLSFYSTLRSEGRLVGCGRVVTPDSITVSSSELWRRSYLSGPTDGVFVAVHAGVLAHHLHASLGLSVCRELLGRGLAVVDASIVAQFGSTMLDILSNVAMQPDALKENTYRAKVIDTILQMLVAIVKIGLIAGRPLPSPSTRSYIVERATQYFDTHLSDPLAISDVCKALHVCPRTLRYSFEELLGVSPTRYLLTLRLGRVRKALLSGTDRSPIHCIAQRYGFCHMGRFARFYREAFGERPSETSVRECVTQRPSPRTSTLNSALEMCPR